MYVCMYDLYMYVCMYNLYIYIYMYVVIPIFRFKFSLIPFPLLENYVFFSVFTFAKSNFPLLLYLFIF